MWNVCVHALVGINVGLLVVVVIDFAVLIFFTHRLQMEMS